MEAKLGPAPACGPGQRVWVLARLLLASARSWRTLGAPTRFVDAFFAYATLAAGIAIIANKPKQTAFRRYLPHLAEPAI